MTFTHRYDPDLLAMRYSIQWPDGCHDVVMVKQEAFMTTHVSPALIEEQVLVSLRARHAVYHESEGRLPSCSLFTNVLAESHFPVWQRPPIGVYARCLDA